MKLVTLPTPVVKLPTLLTLKLSWKVGGTGILIHFFSLSSSKKSWTPLVFVSKHVTKDGKIRRKYFWSPIYTKSDNIWVDFMVKRFGPNDISLFFSKYVIIDFHHFFLKTTHNGDNDKTKKNWDTTPLKLAQNGKKRFLC